MTGLSQETCVPCRGGEPPLPPETVAELHRQIPAWELIEQDGIQKLTRAYKFPNFQTALAFTNRVGAAAEAADHHPAILTEWGRVTVTWWTHTVRGLHRNDFIMAARTDLLYEEG